MPRYRLTSGISANVLKKATIIAMNGYISFFLIINNNEGVNVFVFFLGKLLKA